MPLFEVAILEHPTPKAKKNGEVEKLIAKEEVIAKDEQTAGMSLALNGAAEALKKADMNRIQVIVRPF